MNMSVSGCLSLNMLASVGVCPDVSDLHVCECGRHL